MEYYTDIHSHMLSGTDDGASDEREMYAMLDISYRTGTRRLCLTPHFNKVLWNNNRMAADKAFSSLQAYAAEKYPDMSLHMGNELFYCENGTEYLGTGECRTLNGTRFVLVDFHSGALWFEIRNALLGLVNSGYIPVFAHVERYYCIKSPFNSLKELREFGVMVQINSTSVCGSWGKDLQKKSLKIIKRGLCDVIASDAHSTNERNPDLGGAAALIKKKFGEEYAVKLFQKNPDRILGIRNN